MNKVPHVGERAHNGTTATNQQGKISRERTGHTNTASQDQARQAVPQEGKWVLESTSDKPQLGNQEPTPRHHHGLSQSTCARLNSAFVTKCNQDHQAKVQKTLEPPGKHAGKCTARRHSHTELDSQVEN